MASYAALVSLNTIIDTLQKHPNPPISIDRQQSEALVGKVAFLQQFLEVYSNHPSYEPDDLESLIRDTACDAEDVIESYIVDQIDGSTRCVESSNHGELFYQDLQKVVEKMDAFCEKAVEIKEKMGEAVQHHMSSNMDASQVCRPSLRQQNIMVGFDNVLIKILDKLTGQHAGRIIPIVGMGGAGKTTLALKAYEHALVVERFDFRVWATISQRFSVKEILLGILYQICGDAKETLRDKTEYLLGEKIHKEFSGRRYLIVMDDMWSSEAWEKVQRFFPDNNNGSRMIVTTRITRVALQLSSSTGIQLNLLDDEKSWDLFCRSVFRSEACPLELEEIGKTIAKNCRGLPLSIVVVGGLLAKSKKEIQFWEYIARNLSSIVNMEDDERCYKILHLSYKHLPVHLKSCFLYMGIFPEDAQIRASWLGKLLVSEGFLKPIGDENMEAVDENMEAVAGNYIKELADRNLILVDKLGYSGKIKIFKIHDLARDLCLREAAKDKFLCVVGEHNLNTQRAAISSRERRIAVEKRVLEEDEHSAEGLNLQFASSSLARSLVWNVEEKGMGIPPLHFRLLRIFKAVNKEVSWSSEKKYTSSSVNVAFQFYNSRYLAVRVAGDFYFNFHSSICLLWNLQTLIVLTMGRTITAPIEFWKMPQLKHVEFRFLHLPDPPEDNFVMWNLQTLSRTIDFKCTAQVVKRIPNVKKLWLAYQLSADEHSNFCLNNLGQMNKIEHLSCQFWPTKEGERRSNLWPNFTFPGSLKRLLFSSSYQNDWEDVTKLIGSLPNLETLTLWSIKGTEWRPNEGQFSRLKVLKICSSEELEVWTMDSSHFPLLEHLLLFGLDNLVEVPSCIGEIPTLQSIKVWECSDSCVISAQKIAQEQEEAGNSDLQIEFRYKPHQRERLSREQGEPQPLRSWDSLFR